MLSSWKRPPFPPTNFDVFYSHWKGKPTGSIISASPWIGPCWSVNTWVRINELLLFKKYKWMSTSHFFPAPFEPPAWWFPLLEPLFPLLPPQRPHSTVSRDGASKSCFCLDLLDQDYYLQSPFHDLFKVWFKQKGGCGSKVFIFHQSFWAVD